MERYFVAAVLSMSIAVPLLAVAAGDQMRLGQERDIPFLDNARSMGLSRDPVKRARVEMYLSEARALLDDPSEHARACSLLQQASRAASVEARELHRQRCEP